MRPGSTLRATVVKQVLQGSHGRRVLDIGGYDGSVSTVVGGTADIVVLVDIDEQGLRRAPRDAVVAVLGSGAALPIADETVDLVLSFDVLVSLRAATKEAFLREIRRVVRPDGLVLVTEVAAGYRLPLVDNESLFRVWGALEGIDLSELSRLLGDAGLDIVQQRRFYGVIPRFLYAVMFVRNLPPRGFRLKMWLWRQVAALDRRWSPGAKAHLVVAVPTPVGAAVVGGTP